MGHCPHALRQPVGFLLDDLGGVPHRDIAPRPGPRTCSGHADTLCHVRHHQFQGWEFLTEAYALNAGITVPRLPAPCVDVARVEGYAVRSMVFGLWGNHLGV